MFILIFYPSHFFCVSHFSRAVEQHQQQLTHFYILTELISSSSSSLRRLFLCVFVFVHLSWLILNVHTKVKLSKKKSVVNGVYVYRKTCGSLFKCERRKKSQTKIMKWKRRNTRMRTLYKQFMCVYGKKVRKLKRYAVIMCI